jgi:hypothetical protein
MGRADVRLIVRLEGEKQPHVFDTSGPHLGDPRTGWRLRQDAPNGLLELYREAWHNSPQAFITVESWAVPLMRVRSVRWMYDSEDRSTAPADPVTQ